MADSIKTSRWLFKRTWDLIILSRTNKHYFCFVSRNYGNGSFLFPVCDKNIQRTVCGASFRWNSFRELKLSKKQAFCWFPHELNYCQVAGLQTKSFWSCRLHFNIWNFQKNCFRLGQQNNNLIERRISACFVNKTLTAQLRLLRVFPQLFARKLLKLQMLWVHNGLRYVVPLQTIKVFTTRYTSERFFCSHIVNGILLRIFFFNCDQRFFLCIVFKRKTWNIHATSLRWFAE